MQAPHPPWAQDFLVPVRPISEERSVECLRAIGCDVEGGDTLSVTPPPWRPDLTDAQAILTECEAAIANAGE